MGKINWTIKITSLYLTSTHYVLMVSKDQRAIVLSAGRQNTNSTKYSNYLGRIKIRERERTFTLTSAISLD